MITPAIDTFKRKTGYNLRVLFESYNSFINNHYQNIVDYYNGADIVQDSFIMLEYLLGEVKKVEPLFDQYSNGFNTTDFWSIITAFSDMQCKLETCENMGKWQRSSRLNRFSSNINIAHVQEQNETIEKIAQKAGYLGVDKWVDIAIDNQMEEEDYTNAGGALFTIKLPNNSNFDLDNIIDNLSLTNI